MAIELEGLEAELSPSVELEGLEAELSPSVELEGLEVEVLTPVLRAAAIEIEFDIAVPPYQPTTNLKAFAIEVEFEPPPPDEGGGALLAGYKIRIAQLFRG